MVAIWCAAAAFAEDYTGPRNPYLKYDHETYSEAEKRKARERKEVEVDMLEMHSWFCDQEENHDLYLCEAFRDYRAGVSEEEMARKRPKDNPASDHIDWMHTSFCAIPGNDVKQPCKMFKPKRNTHEYL